MASTMLLGRASCYSLWPSIIGYGFRSGYYVTGFGVDFSKLKSVQWVTNSIRRSLQLRLAAQNALIRFLRPSTPDPSPRLSFECGICMEEMPEDSIARPDPCEHAFCRECLREHVTARLDEHRFPILCPTCIAGKGKGKGAAGGTCYELTVNLVTISCYVCLEVSRCLALDLGLNNVQYSIWTEMEMAPFSVLLCCQKYVHGILSPVPPLIPG
jgi:hypothetical protein